MAFIQKYKYYKILSSLLTAFISIPLSATPESPTKMQWWEAARFGMFIHWGVYSALEGEYNGPNIDGKHIIYTTQPGTVGAEWIMRMAAIPRANYKNFASKFTASKYDPSTWVKLAKDAGMKYIIITTKHHEGFCLFDTKATDWNAINSAAGKDLLKPLVDAAREEGLKVGFYFSQNIDWMHGGFGYIPELKGPASDEEIQSYVMDKNLPMIKELLTNYGKIDILWWDIPYENNNPSLAQKMYDEAKKWGGEDLIMNDRLAPGIKGDYTTPEQYVPDNSTSDFEVCMTLNTTWGYSKFDQYWKSPLKLLYNLSNIASKGGNYLLNIGPKEDGSLTDETIEILTEIGNWMEVNGEAIHGTQRRPTVYNMPFGVCTQKKEGNSTKIYFHVYLWKGNKLFIPGILNPPSDFKARILGIESDIKIESHENGLQLSNLPQDAPFLLCSIIELSTEKELKLSESMYVGENKSTLISSIYAKTDKVSNYDFSLEIPRAFWQEARNQSKITFPITVRKSGVYNIHLNIAGDSGSVHASIDGKEIGALSLIKTESYDFKKRLISTIPLEAINTPSTLELDFSFADQNNLANLISVEFEYLYPTSLNRETDISEQIYFYPNPAKNEIFISGNTIADLSIYSLNGFLLFQSRGNKFDISFLNKGMYIIKIETPKNTIRGSLIKE